MSQKASQETAPLRLFLSYASVDQRLATAVENHLAGLVRERVVEIWARRKLRAGDVRDDAIQSQLEEADLIAILVSADYLAADECYEAEMNRALVRHAAGVLRVVPVVLRSVDWGALPLGRLVCLPPGGKAVTLHRNRDAAYRDVALGIRRAATELRAQRQTAHPLDRIAELTSQRLVTRAHKVAADEGGAEVYVTSNLFQVTLPVQVGLERPAGVLLDRVVYSIGVPTAFDYRGRVGARFDYRLVLREQILDPARTLAAQGVQASDVLWLETGISLVASTRPLEALVPSLHLRGGDDWEEEARGAARAALVRALQAADLAGETTDGGSE